MRRSNWVSVGIGLALTAEVASGCASRSTDVLEADDARRSATRRDAPPAVVTAALEADPPLPGERDVRWFGLEPEPPREHPINGAGQHREPGGHAH
jgi:hypothetical protein